MSVTLATARAEVAKRAQEFLAGTATGGSTTTLADSNFLTHQDNYWNESIVLVAASGSANDGLQRRVQTFTSSTATLTMYSAFPASVASGADYQLYRRFSPGDVDTAINRSLNIAAPDFREKVRAVATATSDTLQYSFPTGPDLMDKGLVEINYQYYTDSSQSTWPFTKLSSDMYEVIEDWNGTTNEKKLQLRFNPETNRLIQFVFDGALGNVSTGTDRIHLDLPQLEWLYSQSTAELWRIETSRTADSNRRAALEEAARWEQNADRLRRQLGHEQPHRPLRRTSFRVT
jgi:hypothetical protein